MKRDWDKIRCILKKVEALPINELLTYDYGDVKDSMLGHAQMLAREGYLVAESNPRFVKIEALTMKGHDLLEELRSRLDDD